MTQRLSGCHGDISGRMSFILRIKDYILTLIDKFAINDITQVILFTIMNDNSGLISPRENVEFGLGWRKK